MSISLFRAIASQYHDLRRLSSVVMMNVISRLIEEQVLTLEQPAEFFAGFQRFSNVLPQRRRYERLGAACRRVYVFGVRDIAPPAIAGVEFVELAPDDALAREWFLVVDTPELWTALLTRASDRGGGPDGRTYDGVWSYDAQVVEQASLLLSQALGREYEPVRQRDHERQSAHLAQISDRMLARLERVRAGGERRWVHLCTLQKFAEALAKNRRTASLARDTVCTLREIFGASDATAALHLGDDRFLLVGAHDDAPQTRALALDHGASGEAFRGRRTLSLADAARSRALDPLMPGAVSLVAAPIAGRRRTYGVLTVGGDRPSQWSAEDAQTVTALAQLMAGVLDQRADAVDDTGVRLERTQGLEQAMAKLREASSHVAELTRELHLLGASGLTPTQRLAVTRAEEIAEGLAKDLGGSGQPASSPEAARRDGRAGERGNGRAGER